MTAADNKFSKSFPFCWEVGGDKGKKSVNAYIILTKLFSWN